MLSGVLDFLKTKKSLSRCKITLFFLQNRNKNFWCIQILLSKSFHATSCISLCLKNLHIGEIAFGAGGHSFNKDKLCSMTCGKVLLNTKRWHLKRKLYISQSHDIRMGWDPPSATGWFQKYKVIHLPLWFRNGNRVVQIQKCMPLNSSTTTTT